MGEFVHLHVHSEYSLLDGAARLEDIVKKAKSLNQTAIALTDHGAMYGLVDFFNAAKKHDVKPILGFEAYAVKNRFDKTSEGREYGHLILLAKNDTGYKNLMKLCSAGFLEGFYYKPRIDYDILETYSEGVICCSACIAGDIPQLLLNGKEKEARELALRLKRIFGEDFYIELQNHGIREEKMVLPMLIKLARELDIEMIATNDSHYVNKEDSSAQDILMSLQMGRTLAEGGGLLEVPEFYIKSTEEMEKIFDFIPEAVENTKKLADKCNVELVQGVRYMPEFQIPEGFTNTSYFEHLVDEGMKKRYGSDAPLHRERQDYEVGVIENMGFTDYFLIVWDYVNFAKLKNIMVGPGRGSAAGSIVAYALGITDIDPIEYNLLFERFLNPERVSMPDIDIDFCIERRKEVIDYVAEKYGKDHVAQAITFGTLGARQVVKDVARVMGIPLSESDRVSKLVPRMSKNLTEALENSSALRTEYDSNEEIRSWLDTAMKIEGMPRQSSTHAAAVVISAKPITEYSPLVLNKKDESITTQYNMHNIEALGLLKMDFLGLRTLTVIRDALKMIKDNHGIELDLANINLEDKNVYDMISRGETDGIFQLESDGMRSLMMRMKPGTLGDIMVGIALFRPGPMAKIPEYIECKKDPSKVHYDHPILEKILSDTYGCMVYQEQVMEIVRDMAGYSLGRSDEVRRAMAKKKVDAMERERKIFIYGDENTDGAIKRGVPEQVAKTVFDQMMDFAQYAFNKSHACAYAYVTYQTAYLKYYYPNEFMTAMLNSFISTADKVSYYMRCMKKMGLEILPPDINRSERRFSVQNGSVRFGLSALSNVGDSIEGVIEERNKNGEYSDFEEFIKRNISSLNKTQIESLILSGSFDTMGYRRSQLMAIYEKLFKSLQVDAKNSSMGQLSLFALGDVPVVKRLELPDIPEFDDRERLSLEKQKVGLYLSGHPLQKYEKSLEKAKWTVEKVLALSENEDAFKNYDGKIVELSGVISQVKTRTTRRTKQTMANASFEDLTGSINMLIFPTVYENCRYELEKDEICTIRARISLREDEIELLLDRIGKFAPGIERKELSITLESRDVDMLRKIKGMFAAYYNEEEGSVVRIHVNNPEKDYYLKKVIVNDELLDKLNRLLGKNNVIYV